MADYHTVYKEPEGTTTEWEDLQIKYGNMEPRAKPEKAKPWEPSSENNRNKEDEDDDLDLDDDEDDSFMAQYRQKRMAELKTASLTPQFGSVELIKGSDFVREVTNASHNSWVVVHLFKEGLSACALLERSLEQLAQRFRSTKFVRIVSTDCIPKYPDANLPTVLVYKGGQVKESLVGLQPYSVPGISTCSPEAVALALCKIGTVLAGTDESEEEVMERVRKDVVLGIVEHHAKNERERDEDSD